MTDLTETCKDGKLEDGYYYCALHMSGFIPEIYRVRHNCLPYACWSYDEKVLEKVPSYDEFKNLKEKLDAATDALYKIATQASIWEPVTKLKSGISKIGTLRDVARKALNEIDEKKNND